MRLRTSRPSCDEQILGALNNGYELAREIAADHASKRVAGAVNIAADLSAYRQRLVDWVNSTIQTLTRIFPTALEANLFSQRFSVHAASYSDMDSDVGALVLERLPTYLDRLHLILDMQVKRYSDLPQNERLFVEDVDSFSKVRDVNPGVVAPLLKKGRIELSEDEVQMSLEAILEVPFHRKDWPGEINDLYTANMVLNGQRRATAFLLKGNGLRKNEMQIRDCGKNGDQLIRLFQSPAQLFIVQYVGPISDAVIQDVRGKTLLRRSQGIDSNYLILDGQDTARLLVAYGKLSVPTTD